MELLNVFGTPVTDETVRLVRPGINRPITARDRAEVALQYVYEDNRFWHVFSFTYSMRRDDYGDGTATAGMIYNSTGGDLTLVLNHTWEGNIWRHPYPRVIKNGQWAGFLHVTDRLTAHSKEAVVYRGTNDDGLSRDWMLSWNNLPVPTTINNQNPRVYTEIRDSNAGGFDWANWYSVDAAMEKQSDTHSITSLGCVSGVQNINVVYPMLVVVMALDGLGIEFTAIASGLSTISKSLLKGDQEGGVDDATPAAAK